MNKRYEELNQKIRQWYDQGQDKLLLQTLYSQCNLQHHDLLAHAIDLKDGTKFADLTDKELVAQFNKDPFNKYSVEDLNHLMQEVHNRYIGENKWDITRSVLVRSNNPEDEGVFGYCCYADDLLFINNDMISEAKNIKDRSQAINAETVGKYFLDTIWHETKHIIQYEDGIDLALGRKQDEEHAFSAAAMMVMMTNFNIAEAKNDYAYMSKWQSMYRVHFCEHEANYAALKKSELNTEDELKKSFDYQMYASDSAALALGFYPDANDDHKNKGAVKNRVNKIENYLRTQINYFNSGIEDCPMKQTIMGILNEYMEQDENGNSKFKERMTREVGEIVDVYVQNKRKMNSSVAKNTNGNRSKNGGKKKPHNVKEVEDENFLGLMR